MAEDWVSGGVRITREMVVAKVRALFAPADQEAVLSILDDSTGRSPRVMMGILKLAGGSVDAVLEYALEARTDYRDVLGAAEYPRQGRAWAEWERLPEPERDRLRREDRDEYLAWLETAPPREPA